MPSQRLIILITIALLIFGAAIFFANFSGGSTWLWNVSQGGTVLMPLLIVSALVDSINPCALSILIVSLIFLFGIKQHYTKILAYGLAYILGIFVVYFLIGLGILQALHIFGVPHFMSKIAAALLVLFGIINILEALFPKFPIRFSIPHR